MAKNTTGSGATIDGVTVVHPDNIGKGIKWNETTKKYEVDVKEDSGIIINELGELEVRVSELEDNALRVIDGKLYYGTRARPELANLYVDAINGVDQDPLKVSGAGTRNNPLRTISYALRLAELNTYRVIYLMEQQEHEVSASDNVDLESGTCILRPYGSKFDVISSNSPDGSTAVATFVDQGLEPYLVLKGFRTSRNNSNTEGWFLFDCLSLNETSLKLDGVSVMVDLNETLPTLNAGLERIVVYSRIVGNGEFYTVRNKIKSRGSITNNSALPSSALTTEKGFSSIGLIQGTNLSINLYNNRNDIGTDVNCHILTNHGWNVASDTSTTLNALANSESNKRAIAERVYVPIKQTINSGTFVSVPNTSINHSYF